MERGRFTQFLFVHVVTKDGHSVEGTRVYEDSFTIELKDATGKFHSFKKLELAELEKVPGKSVMPSFKDTLSATQLDDLVAYLASLKGAPMKTIRIRRSCFSLCAGASPAFGAGALSTAL